MVIGALSTWQILQAGQRTVGLGVLNVTEFRDD